MHVFWARAALETVTDWINQDDNLQFSTQNVNWKTNSVYCKAAVAGKFARITLKQAVGRRECDAADGEHCDGAQTYRSLFHTSQAEQEISFLKALQHPNIVELTETSVGLANLPATVCTTVLYGATLQELQSQALSVNMSISLTFRGLFRTLIGAVGYLHSREIAHRRVAPRHVLVPSSRSAHWWQEVRLSGFREAARFGSSALVGQPADARYRSPEMCTRISYSELVDVWAAAATCVNFLGHSLSDGSFKAGLHLFGNGRNPQWLQARETNRAFDGTLRSALASQPFRRKSAAWLSESLREGSDTERKSLAEPLLETRGQKRTLLASTASSATPERWEELARVVADSQVEMRTFEIIRSELEKSGRFDPSMIEMAARDIKNCQYSVNVLVANEYVYASRHNSMYAAALLSKHVKHHWEVMRTSDEAMTAAYAETDVC